MILLLVLVQILTPKKDRLQRSIELMTLEKNRPVRFDGVDGNVMIDRKKISVVTTPKAKNQAIRQSESLKNNGITGRWEVPNQAQANRAQKIFDELGIKNIEVKIAHE